MEIMEAIYERRSTRTFLPEPVTKPLLMKVIDAAIQAPSAVNEQPWDFTIVQNAALLDHISDAAKQHMLKMMEKGAFPRRLHENLENPDFHVFYHAPVLVVISVKPGQWAVEDAALAAENLMLAARALNLGSCWIGFSQSWLQTSEGKASIGLKDSDVIPIAPIILGHPAGSVPAVLRGPARIHWID